MYALLCKRLLLELPSRSRALESSTAQLGFLQFDNTSSIHIIRFFSSSFKKRSSDVDNEDKQSFAVSYLINSCGLSLTTAIATAEKVNLQTPDNADSVLALLRNHELSKTQISEVVRKRPKLLIADAEKTLLPKLQFFYSIGVSSADLPTILSRNPSLLTLNLDRHLIPGYNYLKSVIPEERVVVTFNRYPRLFSYCVQKIIAPKVAFLSELGVRQSHTSIFITCHPGAALHNNEKFIESVDKAIKMGFHPSKSTFILAIQVISQMTESTWEHKMEVYRRWGWSEDDVLMAFKIYPTCMNLSEKKIVSTMDFLVNKMGWQSTAIARNPSALFYNLERRIIPRCSVINVLLSKGLINNGLCLCTFLQFHEKQFLDKFVTKYQEEVPQLLNAYTGKIDLLELDFGS